MYLHSKHKDSSRTALGKFVTYSSDTRHPLGLTHFPLSAQTHNTIESSELVVSLYNINTVYFIFLALPGAMKNAVTQEAILMATLTISCLDSLKICNQDFRYCLGCKDKKAEHYKS